MRRSGRRLCDGSYVVGVLCAQASHRAGRGASPTALTPALSGADRPARPKTRSTPGARPGIAIGVVQDGRLVYARGFGFATLEKHVPMTPDTEFYVGGLTMEFTAAAMLLLSQDGKLKLDDPGSKYVPEFKLAANVTIAQLLTQTSGLPNYAARRVSTPTRRVRSSSPMSSRQSIR